ncbi:MAG: DUF3443 family protein [Pseudobdellovibrionaceae bacterium]
MNKFLLIFLSILTVVPSWANEMPFSVGKDVTGFNVPFVSVKICVPGTSNCRIIDKIKLDTGSEGLKIYHSALQGLELPIENDTKGNKLAVCATFAGGTGDFGPIASTDLFLGDQSAPQAKIQIVDPDFYSSDRIPCNSLPNDGRNGILGMDTALNARNGKTYYSCGQSGCSKTSIDISLQPLNPLAYMSENSNGFIVKTPNIPTSGAANISGLVIFGIGTQENNQPPFQSITCHVRSDDFFQLAFKGKKYWTKLDSGTNAFNIPQDSLSKLPFCPNSSVYLCPNQAITLNVDLLNSDGSTCSPLDITILADINGPSSPIGSWVVPDLGENWQNQNSSFMLGMPFFFGRMIYYGLSGKRSPLGTGPLVAF